MKATLTHGSIELIHGDITDLATDAIVNAANAQLVLGGGVAGAIRKKGGPSIQEECKRIGGTFVGGAVITGAGRLKAHYVIHAVGPRQGEGNEDEKLLNATRNSLKVALDNDLKSIAFPALSTGIFGFPVERCARLMLRTCIHHLQGQPALELIVFSLFDTASFTVFQQELKRQLGNEASEA